MLGHASKIGAPTPAGAGSMVKGRRPYFDLRRIDFKDPDEGLCRADGRPDAMIHKDPSNFPWNLKVGLRCMFLNWAASSPPCFASWARPREATEAYLTSPWGDARGEGRAPYP